VSRYLKLERAGASLKAKCPFHNEKTPSFFVSPDRGTYYCFGCGAKGDIFTFVEEFERVDFRGALKILAEIAGVEIVPERPADRQNKNEKERLFAVVEEAARFYERNLAGEEGKAAADYLLGRGLRDRTIKDWRLGFAPDAWDTLLTHLTKKGFKESEIEKAGLIKRSEKGSGFYDRFRSRIMFPIFDSSGRVIAFSSRILEKTNPLSQGSSETKEAKYVNSPETPLFNKSEVLYGYNRAKSAIRELNYAVLVEGQMDLLMMHQSGLRNTVASSGTALSDRHLKILKRSSDNVLFAYDGDPAGIKATLRSWAIALLLGMDVKIAAFPEGEDPASLLQKSPEQVKEVLKNSKHIINFYLDILIAEESDSRKLGKKIEVELLPLIRSLPSDIDQHHFLKMTSEKTNIPMDTLTDDLNKITVEEIGESQSGDYNWPENPTGFPASPSLDFRERRLWGIIFWQESLKEPQFETAELRSKIAEIFGPTELEEKLNLSPEVKADLIFEAEIHYGSHPSVKSEAEELLSYLEEDYLKDQLGKALTDLQIAEREKNPEEVERLLTLCQELSQKISAKKISLQNVTNKV